MRELGSWLLLVLALFSLPTFWFLLQRDVGAVVIEGPLSTAERAAVQAVVQTHVHDSLLQVDLPALVADVVALSWPQAVAVRRIWPDKLVLGVEKQQVVAAWQDGQYLTSNGQVVSLETLQSGLPILRASRSEPSVALEIFQRLSQITQLQNRRIAQLHENSLREWQVELDSGLAIMLGQAATAIELSARLQRVFDLMTRLPEPQAKAIAYADTRYTNGVAVRLRTMENETSLAAISTAASK